MIGALQRWHLEYRLALFDRALLRVRREIQACPPGASVFDIEAMMQRERLATVGLAVARKRLEFLRQRPAQSTPLDPNLSYRASTCNSTQRSRDRCIDSIVDARAIASSSDRSSARSGR